MRDLWSYQKEKTFDRQGTRWHFVLRYFHSVPEGEDEPREIFFRNDGRTEFGVLRFDRVQDNPYRDWVTIANKIMNNKPFRKTLLNHETADVWKKNWK